MGLCNHEIQHSNQYLGPQRLHKHPLPPGDPQNHTEREPSPQPSLSTGLILCFSLSFSYERKGTCILRSTFPTPEISLHLRRTQFPVCTERTIPETMSPLLFPFCGFPKIILGQLPSIPSPLIPSPTTYHFASISVQPEPLFASKEGP